MKDCQWAVERAIAGRQMDVTLESIHALAQAMDRRLDRIQAGVPLPGTPSVPPIPISPEETLIYDDMQEGIAVIDEDVVEPASVMNDYPTPPVVFEEDLREMQEKQEIIDADEERLSEED